MGDRFILGSREYVGGMGWAPRAPPGAGSGWGRRRSPVGQGKWRKEAGRCLQSPSVGSTFLRLENAVTTRGRNLSLAPAATGLGLYVHVPFCSSTCDFCAFYQEKPGPGDFDRYVSGIARELDLLERPLPVATVFWGGGTPGLLTPEHIRRLGAVLRSAFAGEPVEWSVEMTPGCVKEGRLEALREIGVTRVSLGAQSFQPRLLDALGRMHPRERIFSAYDLLRRHGFSNVNLDLMFALPGQSLEEWQADMDEAVALQPDHLSTYCLTFEEDTALFVKLSQGKVSLDEEKEIAFYRTAWERLAAAGYEQYEVSNYARPGSRCVHNLNTWNMREWIGLGPSAASQYQGWRSSNRSSLSEWLADLEAGARSADQRQTLSPLLLATDFLIFGLRLNDGVDLEVLPERFSVEVGGALERYLNGLVGDGLAGNDGSRLWLTPEGRLVVDRVGMELMEVMEA
jgi:oxygen-independent coproporphyrinogen III oxidase